jgi:ribosomal protection tetracycline resistance protein
VGVGPLLDGIGDLLPPAPAPENRLRARVFAIEQGASGEKVAYVRSYGGQLRVRQRVTVYRREPEGTVGDFNGQISALRVVGERDGTRATLIAGHIGQIRGLAGIRIGDQIGSPDGLAGQAHFARPSLETVVRAERTTDAPALHAALVSLAEQDPLIHTQVNAEGGSSVLLYGEVQKEVIAATLADVYGVRAAFAPSTIVHIERPVGTGTAYEPIGHGFAASVGLRVGPALGEGLVYRLEVELGSLPLAFHRAIEETVRQTLEQGAHGWPVTDVAVTLTQCGYWSPVTVAGDFRNLTPFVLAQALAVAGTRVYEPCHHFDVEVPLDRLGPVIGQLSRLGAHIHETVKGSSWQITGDIPARLVPAFQRQLPGLSSGEGVWSSRLNGDRPVPIPPPTRRRTDGNPFNRAEYTRFLAQR